MTSVFFSYSHADEALRDELEKHLAVMKNQGVIDTWHDRRIAAGQEFNDEIDVKINGVDVILLLFSSDFLASEYCYKREARRALDRHEAGEARVIPIILRPCDWQNTPFKKLLAVPKDGKPVTRWTDRDEAFLNIVGMIRAAVEQLKGSVTPRPVSERRLSSDETRNPRSSNLRLAKEFTDRDRDRFLDGAFDFIARYFENSLDELKNRNSEIDVSFRREGGGAFEASIYVGGKRRAFCGVWREARGNYGGNILYSSSGITKGSYNESLSVEADKQSLFLRPLGMARHGAEKGKLSEEGAAEYLWNMLVDILQ